MPNHLVRIYFTTWLKKTFSGPWAIAMLSAGVLGLVVSFVADSYPAWTALANRAAWQLPLALFLLTLIPAAVHASWKLYEDMLQRFAKASGEAQELREQLAERIHYQHLSTALSDFHREASEGWINLRPSTDQALAENWRPKANAWFAKVKAVLTLYEVPRPDLAHFEVVNNLDIEKFGTMSREEVLKMWVRVERVADLAKKYEELARR